MAKNLVDQLRAKLPAELKDHLGEMRLAGLLNSKVIVKCTPQYTMEIRGCLADILKEGAIKVNDVVPYVVAERPAHQRIRLQKMGRMLEAARVKARDLMGVKIDMEARTCSIYAHVDGEERPVIIAEVLEHGDIKGYEENCVKHLQCPCAEILSAASR